MTLAPSVAWGACSKNKIATLAPPAGMPRVKCEIGDSHHLASRLPEVDGHHAKLVAVPIYLGLLVGRQTENDQLVFRHLERNDMIVLGSSRGHKNGAHFRGPGLYSAVTGLLYRSDGRGTGRRGSEINCERLQDVSPHDRSPPDDGGCNPRHRVPSWLIRSPRTETVLPDTIPAHPPHGSIARVACCGGTWMHPFLHVQAAGAWKVGPSGGPRSRRPGKTVDGEAPAMAGSRRPALCLKV